jgi:hypothetical protein
MTNANPFAAPQAPVDDPPSDIDSLNISERWKARFRLMLKAGAPGFANLKNLPPEERRRASFGFNVLAFLFGPLYYVAKGMWRKGLTLFVACFAATLVAELVLTVLGFQRFGKFLTYGVAAVFAVRANVDYYKKMVLGDNGWW